MTAFELIDFLKRLKPETKIVVRGYEDGYNDILQIKPVKIKQKVDSHWYDGEYDESDEEDVIDAVDLFGKNKNAID